VMPPHNVDPIQPGDTISFPTALISGPDGGTTITASTAPDTWILPVPGTFTVAWDVPFSPVDITDLYEYAIITGGDILPDQASHAFLGTQGAIAVIGGVISSDGDVADSGSFYSYNTRSMGSIAQPVLTLATYLYSAMQSLPSTGVLDPSVGSYTAGVYDYTGISADFNSVSITVSGEGLFVFRAYGITLSGSGVSLASGASAANVFWVCGDGGFYADTSGYGTVIATGLSTVAPAVEMIWIGSWFVLEDNLDVVSGRNIIYATPWGGTPPLLPAVGQVAVQVQDGDASYAALVTAFSAAPGAIAVAGASATFTTTHANATVQLVSPSTSVYLLQVAEDQSANVTFCQLS